jgi:hypothetical protein
MMLLRDAVDVDVPRAKVNKPSRLRFSIDQQPSRFPGMIGSKRPEQVTSGQARPNAGIQANGRKEGGKGGESGVSIP